MKNKEAEKIITGMVICESEIFDSSIKGNWSNAPWIKDQRLGIRTETNKVYRLMLLDEMVEKYKLCDSDKEMSFKCKKENFHYMWIVKDILLN